MLAILTLGLATAAFLHRGEPLTEGAIARASFILAARDSRNAECAADLDVAGYRCRYDANEQPDGDATAREAVPLNARRGLVLLDGFFEQEAVAARVREELSRVRRKRFELFRVDCTLRFVHRVDDVKARWRPGPWIERDGVWLALVQDCDVGK